MDHFKDGVVIYTAWTVSGYHPFSWMLPVFGQTKKNTDQDIWSLVMNKQRKDGAAFCNRNGRSGEHDLRYPQRKPVK